MTTRRGAARAFRGRSRATPSALGALLALAFLGRGVGAGAEAMSPAMKRFVEVEAYYLLTPAEKEAFRALETEAARRAFVDAFWRARDPDPATPENEFRAALLRRIDEANRLFGEEGGPGWKTDRGRVYVLLGPPDHAEVHDTDSVEMAFERALRGDESAGGIGPRSTYRVPFYADETGLGGTAPSMLGKQVWYYEGRAVPGAPDGRIVFRKTPRGRWVLSSARDPIRASPFARGLEQADVPPPTPRGAPFEPAEPTSRLLAERERRALDEMLFDGLVRAGIPTRAGAFVVPVAPDEALVAVALAVDTTALAFEPTGDGHRRARIDVFGAAVEGTGPAARLVRSFSTPVELVDPRREPTRTLTIPLRLPPGRFRLLLGVADAIGGGVGTTSRSLVVPRFGEGLALGSIVLGRGYRTKRPEDPAPIDAGEIDLGGLALRVDPAPRFAPDETVEVFFRAFGAGAELAIDYAFLREGRLAAPVLRRRSPRGDVAQPLPLSAFGLAPGRYRLLVRVEELGTGRTASGEAPFEIVPP